MVMNVALENITKLLNKYKDKEKLLNYLKILY